MKGILIAVAAIAGLTTLGAQVTTDAPAQTCDKAAKTTVVAQQDSATCPLTAQAAAKKDDCCAGADKAKAVVAQAADEKACCKEEAKAVAQVASKEAKECCNAEAKAAVAQVKEDCCTSTEAHPVAKGEDECCNAAGKLAKFKVWADGKYAFYGCEGSANKGRLALVSKGAMSVGPVQAVVGKVTIA